MLLCQSSPVQRLDAVIQNAHAPNRIRRALDWKQRLIVASASKAQLRWAVD